MSTLKDGIYHASARGKFSDIPVDLTVAEGKISDIKVLFNRDTGDFSYGPSIKIPQIVTQYQTLDVDVIAGSTFSSRGILMAIEKCVEQAGGDVEEMRKIPGPEKHPEEIAEKYCDAVVLGTGGSGAMAAGKLADLGAKVIVLEKMHYNGGATTGANCMLAIDSTQQLEADVHNNQKEVFDDMLDWSHYYANGKIVSRFLATTAESVAWMGEKGVVMEYTGKEQFTDKYDISLHFPKFRNRDARRAQLKSILDTVEKNDGEVIYEARGKCILKDDEDKVCGVKAICGDESTLIIHAPVVVVATGCYDGNPELAKKYFQYPARFMMPAPMGWGDGLKMCQDAGAQLDGLGARVTHLNRPERAIHATAGFPGDDKIDKIRQMLGFPGAMMLNYRGKRYASEWWIHNSLAIANAGSAQGDNCDYFVLVNEHFLDVLEDKGAQALGVDVVPGGFNGPYTNEGFFKGVKDEIPFAESIGFVVSGRTIEELAEKLGIDPEVLSAEVERYNSFAKEGVDRDFWKDASLLHAMEEGPYYAIRGTSESYGSVGGILIDECMRVQSTERKPIPGLYAAGSAASGMWGKDSYGCIEGATCSWAFTSGYMAAQSSYEYLKKSSIL